jgi:NAD(P)-dependent dehydrogenase (short-subunit alcohol dehydrogenase family)
MGDLDNKTIIVAGGGPGLGRETALASVRQGANVVIAARIEARLDAIAQEVDARGTGPPRSSPTSRRRSAAAQYSRPPWTGSAPLTAS